MSTVPVSYKRQEYMTYGNEIAQVRILVRGLKHLHLYQDCHFLSIVIVMQQGLKQPPPGLGMRIS